jgi:hypothetical protein
VSWPTSVAKRQHQPFHSKYGIASPFFSQMEGAAWSTRLVQETGGILYTAQMENSLMKGVHDDVLDLTLKKSGTIRVWSKARFQNLSAAVARGTVAIYSLFPASKLHYALCSLPSARLCHLTSTL